MKDLPTILIGVAVAAYQLVPTVITPKGPGGGGTIGGQLLECLCENISKPSPTSRTGQPLLLEVNVGQADAKYQAVTRANGMFVFFDSTGPTIDLRDEQGKPSGLVIPRMEGAANNAQMELSNPMGSSVNYMLGNDPSKYVTDVRTYQRIRYKNVYPGIHTDYYGKSSQLEQDFVLEPGADPARIRLHFDGASSITANSIGDLEIKTGKHSVLWKKPTLYQDTADCRKPIQGRYRTNADGSIGFEVGVYDTTRKLVIDPVIIYGTYLGLSNVDMGARIAVDANGNSYITGFTLDQGYPRSPGAYQPNSGGAATGDVILTKVAADGASVVFTTHIGGSNRETGAGIVVDTVGNIYITGVTNSTDFPVTADAVRSKVTASGLYPSDCFLLKLNASGNALLYSTYLGGSGRDGCSAVAIDATGNAYVTGYTTSSDFPRTDNAYQSLLRGGTVIPDFLALRNMFPIAGGDAFVTKVNPTGTALVYSTYLGGSGNDMSFAIAVDTAGNAYVAGSTTSDNFPITPGAAQSVFGGGGGQGFNGLFFGDAFITKLNPTGTALVYSTYYGGRKDEICTALAIDASGNAYIAGSTLSSDLPVTDQAIQSTYKGAGGDGLLLAGDAFVAKLNPTGTQWLYSTYLGGSRDDRAVGLAVDSNGNAFVAGNTVSTDFPISADAEQRTYGGQPTTELVLVGDAWVAQINPTGRALIYSSYLGGRGGDWALGVAVDNKGAMYVTGGTSSNNFPVTKGAYQTSFYGGPDRSLPLGDAFVVKLGDRIVSGSTVSIAGLASAASYQAGTVAPGEIIILAGTLLGPATLTTLALDANGNVATTLAATRFLFDGEPAAVIYASGGQSSVVVPYQVAGKASTQIVAEYQGVRSAPITVPVVAAKPALFSANSSGRGPGAILNDDNRVNSPANPALKNNIVVLYGTGEGQTNPPGVNGLLAKMVYPKPLLPVSVTIGGLPATVLYSGAAPGLVAGVIQINVQVPGAVDSGDMPVVVKIGDAVSQSGLTVSVK